jgi:hypothetical protein
MYVAANSSTVLLGPSIPRCRRKSAGTAASAQQSAHRQHKHWPGQTLPQLTHTPTTKLAWQTVEEANCPETTKALKNKLLTTTCYKSGMIHWQHHPTADSNMSADGATARQLHYQPTSNPTVHGRTRHETALPALAVRLPCIQYMLARTPHTKSTHVVHSRYTCCTGLHELSVQQHTNLAATEYGGSQLR